MGELNWINVIRAVSMISVYVLHSEAYYGTGGISFGYFLHPFYVNAFFFVSGYLFFRSHSGGAGKAGTPWKKSLSSLLFRLVIPTVLFATLIYVPKMLFHGRGTDLDGYAFNVLGGISYWFTSCLAVSQLLLLAMLLWNKNIWFCFILSCGLLAAACLLTAMDPSPFPWYYKSGMGATFFMTLGGLYRTCEGRLDRFMNRKLLSGVGLAYFSLMLWDYPHRLGSSAMMSVNINALGMLETLLGIILLVYVAKSLPRSRLLAYIGKNSILYYFFSGALPAFFGTACLRFIPWHGYAVTLLVVCLSLAACTVAALVINKWLPFMTDLRKLPFH